MPKCLCRQALPTLLHALTELSGMVITAFVTQVILQHRPETEGDPVLLRGDNFTTVSWVNRCGGSRDIDAFFSYEITEQT